MRHAIFAAGLGLVTLLSGCEQDFSRYLPSQLTNEPVTLEAAVAADQERSDRYSSGDLAGAWLLSTKRFRQGISQSDYIAWIKACKKPGLPITVVGVRMDGPNAAIVREEALGFKFAATMIYEDGQWLREPDDEVAAFLGQSIGEIIASETAAGRCNASDEPATPSPTIPSITAPKLTPTTTSRASGVPSELVAGLLCQQLDAEPTTARLYDQMGGILSQGSEADNNATLALAFEDYCPQYAPLFGLYEKIKDVPEAIAEIRLDGNLSATPISEWTEDQRQAYMPFR